MDMQNSKLQQTGNRFEGITEESTTDDVNEANEGDADGG